MVLVICVCSACCSESFTDKHGTHRGRRVAPSTRSSHEKKDRERKSDTAVGQDSPDAAVASETASEEDAAALGKRAVCIASDIDKVSDLSEDADKIARMICMSLLWLRLCTGASRTTVRKLAGLLTLILAAIASLLVLALKVANSSFELPSITIPLDERTMLQRLRLEPTILRSVRCPRCFTAYPLDNIPETCPHKQSSRARVCGESLKCWRQTRRGAVLVPRCLYSTQSFDSWLLFFLSRPQIEKQLGGSFHPRPADGVMHGIWDSPAWRSLGSFTLEKYNLVFSLYLDWFNPFGNKISGKVVSCGAIILACMNLPPEIRYLPENLFFAGIMPPPL